MHDSPVPRVLEGVSLEYLGEFAAVLLEIFGFTYAEVFAGKNLAASL